MNREEFDRLAKDFECDVYGDIFSESGYGINFAFDLAYALHVYRSVEANGAESGKIQYALAFGSFYAGLGFSIEDFLNTTDQEYNEFTNAKMIYDAIVFQPDTLNTYLDALIWYCTESEKAKNNA